MNATLAEKLIISAYDLEKENRDRYMGAVFILRQIAMTDKTLAKKMSNEGIL